MASDDINRIRWSVEYRAIADHYADDVAKRSGVPLMQHINDGLVVLDTIGASYETMQAYCLHPLLQEDAQLIAQWGSDDLYEYSTRATVLAMEYRSHANAFLSGKVGVFGKDPRVLSSLSRPSWGPLTEVKHMLIADKVQNYKDFLIHHKDKHPRSAHLTYYFELWLHALEVTKDFPALCLAIERARGT